MTPPDPIGIAALPMYDWPELHAPMDRLWAAIAAALRADGLPAPSRLERTLPYDAAWTRPDLVLGQTCGLPMATTLAGVASVVGTFDLGLEACPLGHYRSALLVREDSAVGSLADARGTRLAINNLDSQSGFHSVMSLLPAEPRRYFASVASSGAHRTSLAWLLSGRADIAAIDCHSLALARRFGPDPTGLRVVGYTRACPGTPLITARHRDARRIGDAVERALDALDPGTRGALGLNALWRSTEADYAPLADGVVAARAHRELFTGALGPAARVGTGGNTGLPREAADHAG